VKKLLLLLVLTPIFAAGPDGFIMWKADDLKGYEKKLAPKMNSIKSANENLAKFASYLVEIVHREGDAEAETHVNNSELFFIVSGEATEIVGGTPVNNKTASPGEIHGSALNGGIRIPLRPGDVVRMPANTPHRMLVAAGKQITFMVVKEPVN
jgi:mannose-6-phosphate isomerase-like protein (cupin superfamily)